MHALVVDIDYQIFNVTQVLSLRIADLFAYHFAGTHVTSGLATRLQSGLRA